MRDLLTKMNNNDYKVPLITSLLDDIDFKEQRTTDHKDAHKVSKDITDVYEIIR